MAEFPRRILIELAWVVKYKLNDALAWFHRHVTEEYARKGPRDE